MKIEGFLKHHFSTISIVIGSINNFLDTKVTKRLVHQTEPYRKFEVMVIKLLRVNFHEVVSVLKQSW